MVDARLKNSNILIVDDHKANVEVLEDFLEMEGYINVISTTDSRQVLQLFKSFKPDLILLDLAMPFLSGLEVMEQLKQFNDTNAYLPILILTADVTPESKQQALSRGGYDFLTKPFHLVEVGLRIKNLLLTGYLQKQIEEQNKMLAKKVTERTHELEKINNGLAIAKEKSEISKRQKATLLSIIADEIRTPLKSILGIGTLLTVIVLSIKSRKEVLDLIQTTSKNLVNTITHLVEMSLLV